MSLIPRLLAVSAHWLSKMPTAVGLAGKSLASVRSFVPASRLPFFAQGSRFRPLSLFALTFACSAAGHRTLDPDKPMPFPSEGYDLGTDMSKPVSPPDMGADACVPELCEGVIDYDRSDGVTAACLSFAEVQEEVGLTNSETHWGLSAADYNGDSRTDLLILNEGDSNLLYQNGEGGFTDVAGVVNLETDSNTSRDAAWGDWEGDGDLDLFLAGGWSRFLLNGGSSFSSFSAPLSGQEGRAAVWIGARVLLSTENGTRFYEFDEDGSATDRAADFNLFDPGEGSRIVTADYDGDGREDIYIANITGQNRLSRQRDDGTFEWVEEEIELTAPGNSTDADWVSHQGEVLPSLYVSSWDGGNYFFVNQQDGTFEEQSAALGIRDAGKTTVAAWGDFLNEGRPSLYLGRDGEQNLLYVPILVGDGRTVSRYRETATPLGMALTGITMGAAWLDYNLDGLLDLAVVTYEGAINLFENRTRNVRFCLEEQR